MHVQRQHDVIFFYCVHVGKIIPASAENAIAVIAIMDLAGFNFMLTEVFHKIDPFVDQCRAQPRCMSTIGMVCSDQPDSVDSGKASSISLKNLLAVSQPAVKFVQTSHPPAPPDS